MEMDSFRQAINIGLGRAILHLRNPSWKPYAQLIEHVCLHNTAYDAQCEGSRARYVYEIITLTDDPQHFSALVSAGLLEAREHWDTVQLFDLAALFAKAGDPRARETMFEKFRRQDSQERFTGASQIVRVNGMAGLLFAAEQIGQFLATHPDDWGDDYLLSESREILGADPEPELRRTADVNSNIRRFLETVDQNRKECRPKSEPEYRRYSYEEVKEMIVSRKGDVPCGWLFGWGRHAPEEALRRAATDLLEEKDDKRQLAYLRIFNLRAFPLNSERLVQLARRGNRDMAFASIRALRHIQDESVRQLALDLMDKGPAEGDAIQLLENNFVQGDEACIAPVLDGATNNDEDFHSVTRAALGLFENNPDADALPSMLAVYERCTCGLCRNGAVRILMDRRKMPGWMLQECHYDSNEETREAARNLASLPDQAKE